MKSFYYFLFLLLFVSCSIFKKGETPIKQDATPPPGYSPSYILSQKQFNLNYDEKPDVEFLFANSKQFDTTVRAYFHLIEGKKYYLYGASSKNFSRIWCNAYLIYEGRRERITNFKIYEIKNGENLKNAIAIVSDHSGSMGEWRAKAVQKAISNLIERKRDIDAFSLIRYDHRINVECPLTFSKSMLQQSNPIDGLQRYNGFTAICDAMLEGARSVNQKGFDNKLVIIFTDGFDNYSNFKPDSVISYCIANNIKIIGIDFGDYINPNYIKNIAEKTGGFYRRIYKTEEFDLLFDDIYFRLNNAYVIEFDTDYYGRHFLELEICLKDEKIQRGFFFDNTPDLGQISLLNVYFDLNKSNLKPESQRAIRKLVKLMNSFPSIKIEVRGHTDSLNRSSDPLYNVKLSQERADAVKKELIKQGIPEYRIRTMGFGEKFPVADNSTEEGRQKNRRTEFVIIEK